MSSSANLWNIFVNHPPIPDGQDVKEAYLFDPSRSMPDLLPGFRVQDKDRFTYPYPSYLWNVDSERLPQIEPWNWEQQGWWVNDIPDNVGLVQVLDIPSKRNIPTTMDGVPIEPTGQDSGINPSGLGMSNSDVQPNQWTSQQDEDYQQRRNAQHRLRGRIERRGGDPGPMSDVRWRQPTPMSSVRDADGDASMGGVTPKNGGGGGGGGGAAPKPPKGFGGGKPSGKKDADGDIKMGGGSALQDNLTQLNRMKDSLLSLIKTDKDGDTKMSEEKDGYNPNDPAGKHEKKPLGLVNGMTAADYIAKREQIKKNLQVKIGWQPNLSPILEEEDKGEREDKSPESNPADKFGLIDFSFAELGEDGLHHVVPNEEIRIREGNKKTRPSFAEELKEKQDEREERIKVTKPFIPVKEEDEYDNEFFNSLASLIKVKEQVELKESQDEFDEFVTTERERQIASRRNAEIVSGRLHDRNGEFIYQRDTTPGPDNQPKGNKLMKIGQDTTAIDINNTHIQHNQPDILDQKLEDAGPIDYHTALNANDNGVTMMRYFDQYTAETGLIHEGDPRVLPDYDPPPLESPNRMLRNRLTNIRSDSENDTDNEFQ